MNKKWTRKRVYELINAAEDGDRLGRTLDIALLVLILANVIAAILETEDSVRALAPQLFWWLEIFSVIIFTIEYLVRVWSCTANPRYAHPVWGRVRFMLTPLAMMDFLAIAPAYLPMLGVDLRVLRVLRMFRVFRILKIGQYSVSLRLLGRAFVKTREQMIVTAFVLLILLVVASFMLYYAETASQPDEFGSVLDALWWGVVTVTKVGYHHTHPMTPLGQALGLMIALIGIGFIAMPTGIFGAAFLEELRSRAPLMQQDSVCPTCGRSKE